VAGAPDRSAHLACTFDCRNKADPMTITTSWKKAQVPINFSNQTSASALLAERTK
jgi:hypothetical protein